MDIKWKTPEELEQLALAIINKHQPKALREPQEIDIYTLVESECKKYNYSFEAYRFPVKNGKQILGCVDNKNKKLLLDETMLGQAATSNTWTFVAAHELGHLLLHRQYFEDDQTPYDSSEIEDEIPVNKQLEWQANRFASELLLPHFTVQLQVFRASKTIGITHNLGKVILDEKRHNYSDVQSIIGDISRTFGVSRTVAKIRLKELDIFIDYSDPKTNNDFFIP
jgi:Zn-dependent peptidase ImmA (M78 family)